MTNEQLIRQVLLHVHEAGANGMTQDLLVRTMRSGGLDFTDEAFQAAMLHTESIAKTITSIADAVTGETRLYLSDRGRAALTQYGLI